MNHEKHESARKQNKGDGFLRVLTMKGILTSVDRFFGSYHGFTELRNR